MELRPVATSSVPKLTPNRFPMGLLALFGAICAMLVAGDVWGAARSTRNPVFPLVLFLPAIAWIGLTHIWRVVGGLQARIEKLESEAMSRDQVKAG